MTKKEIRHYIVCNLSYATTSALIKTKLYSKVITNMIEYFYSKQTSALDFNLEIILRRIDSSKTLDAFLFQAFVWHNTPEGHAYWKDIHRKYWYYAIRF